MANVGTKNEIDGLLNDIEEQFDPEIACPSSTGFQFDCLTRVRTKLPPIAVHALELLAEPSTSSAAFAEIYKDCWNTIRTDYTNQPGSDSNVSALRATICALYARMHPDERNIVDHLSFFLYWIGNLEPLSAEHATLFHRHFAGMLK